jgi:hypothetical protein
MPISGDKARRPLTFPDTIWEELDDEAKKEKVTVSELVLRYIAAGRQSPSASSSATDRRLDQLSDEIYQMREHMISLFGLQSNDSHVMQGQIHALPEQMGAMLSTVVDGLFKSQLNAKAAQDETMESRAEALQRWYDINRQYQTAHPPVVIPDVVPQKGAWAWLRWICGAR